MNIRWGLHGLQPRHGTWRDPSGVLSSNLPDGIKKFVKFAVNVWGMSPDGGDEEELAFGGIDALQAFIQEIGLPGTLRELGIMNQSLLKTIADSCIRNDGGYRQLTHAEILDILEECY